MTFAVAGVDEPPFTKDTQITIVDEIREGSLIVIVPKDDNKVEVRLADRTKPGDYENVLHVSKGEKPGQIVFTRVEMEAVDQENREQELNALFEGLTFYYRDFDLPEHILGMYYPGLIIQEPGFTDASRKRGGFVANHRFLIASAAAVDLTAIDQTDPERGLCVMTSDSFFKVLDVVGRNGRRQTTLLHIPAELVELFTSKEVTAFEEQLVANARADFGELVDAAPVPALMKSSWLDRLSSPLGISNEGAYFYSRNAES